MENIMTYDEAVREASRCLGCEEAPCEEGCHAGLPVRKFVRKLRFGNFRGAARLLREYNVFGGSCGYVCAVAHQCEKNCTSCKQSLPIRIGALQCFLAHWERSTGTVFEEAEKDRLPGKVAVVGGGPSGLACAYYLARQGVTAEVFDKAEELGGMMSNAIPSFKLCPEMARWEIGHILNQGVKAHLRQAVAHPRDLLSRGFDAVYLATGLSQQPAPDLPGAGKRGIYSAIGILTACRKAGGIGALSLGKRAVVVGCGNTAVDAARILRHHQVGEVTILYRRDEVEAPSWEEERRIAAREGVRFRYYADPVEILGGGQVTGIACVVTQLAEPGPDGRRKTISITGSRFVLPTDTVIWATGEKADASILKEIKLDAEGRVMLDEQRMTSIPGIFCGGDLAAGPLTVARAAGDGRKAAQGIVAYLKEKKGVRITVATPAKGPETPSLEVTFCGVKFENPFVLAAAPPTDDLEILRHGYAAGWAGAVLKTTSIEGTPVPLKYPMMSEMRLEDKRLAGMGNIDLISKHPIDEVEKRIKILRKEFPRQVVIGSMMGAQKSDWQTLARRLTDCGAQLIECSFSCPQGSLGQKPGFMLGQDPKLVREVTGWVKSAAGVPVVIKITPQVADIVEVVKAVKEGGGDAVCASNSVPGLLGVDLDTLIPYPNVNGRSTYSGFTGPAIRPLTYRTLAEIARNVEIPITGTGGPMDWRDAVQFIALGATNVQFCTAVMRFGFGIIEDLKEGLHYYMKEKGYRSPADWRGKALQYICGHEGLPYESRVVSKIDPDKCVKCLQCVVACRDGGHGAIQVKAERTPEVDPEKCVGCNLCRCLCPVSDCIALVKK